MKSGVKKPACKICDVYKVGQLTLVICWRAFSVITGFVRVLRNMKTEKRNFVSCEFQQYVQFIMHKQPVRSS